MMGDAPGTTTLPTTSLIISTRNRPALVWDVVHSVLAGAVLPTELVVVDQSDLVHTELAERPPATTSTLRYLWAPARGLSRGRNTGIAAATGEVLVFLDDDVLVPDTWFATIVGALIKAGPRAVVTGRVLSGEPENPGAFAPSLIVESRPQVFRGRPGRDVLSSMTMAMYRSAVDEVGDFDVRLGAGSRFPSSEDNDFGYRLLEAGYEIVFDPDIVVVHRAWREPAALLPLRWAYGRGQGAYFIKHASRRDSYMWRRMGRDVGRHLKRAPRRLIRNPQDGMADVTYSLAVLAGAAQWWALPRRRG
jgi:glycosyltransferase involved in cell wall biosynthesis